MSFQADVEAGATLPTPSVNTKQRLYLDSATLLWSWKKSDGSTGPLGANQPSAYAFVSNPGTVVNSVAANNVVDSRPVAAGALVPNLVLEATIRAFLTGNNGVKNLLVGIDADTSNALTATFAAGQTGIVTLNAQFLVKAASPHLLVSRADFNAQYGFGLKRGNVAVNVATTAFNLVTQAWVANAADSITIDSILWTQRGNGV